MKFTRAHATALFIVLASCAVALAVYPYLPEQIISHWNASGMPDGTSTKAEGLLVMPIISLILFAVYLLIPYIDPKAANIEKFRTYFDRFMVTLFTFLFYLYTLTVFWNLGVVVPIVSFLSVAFGVLFYALGGLLEHAESNWTVGVRTPWTLSSDAVWKKTHKLAAKLFKVTAVIGIAGFFFPEYVFTGVVGMAVLTCVVSVLYSFVAFRMERRVDSVRA